MCYTIVTDKVHIFVSPAEQGRCGLFHLPLQALLLHKFVYFLFGGDFVSISEQIKELCGQKGITINQLEKESGVGRGAIARWDAHSPSVEKVAAVANYFGVTVDYLLTCDTQKEKPPAQSGELSVSDIRNLLEKMPNSEIVSLIAEATETLKSRGTL